MTQKAPKSAKEKVVSLLSRWVEVVREGHSVLGFLPGFYDGWLLDYEGEVLDPFTQSERLAALGLRVSLSLVCTHACSALVESRLNQTAKEFLETTVHRYAALAWEPVATGLLDEVINQCVGSAKCKDILQNDWDRIDEGEDSKEAQQRRTKAVYAKRWAVFVTLLSGVFLFFTQQSRHTQKALRELPRSLLDTIIKEPLTMLAQLTVSMCLGRPIAGISYAWRGQ